MPAIRKLPDNTTLRQLRAQGWRLKDIADQYGVGEAAVWKALERAGFTKGKPTYQDLLPWEIEKEHRATAIMERFRTIVRQRKGVELSEREKHLLEVWLKQMEESNVVVNYHPDAPPNDASRKGGWYYVPREDTDSWIIRMPDYKDIARRITEASKTQEAEVPVEESLSKREA